MTDDASCSDSSPWAVTYTQSVGLTSHWRVHVSTIAIAKTTVLQSTRPKRLLLERSFTFMSFRYHHIDHADTDEHYQIRGFRASIRANLLKDTFYRSTIWSICNIVLFCSSVVMLSLSINGRRTCGPGHEDSPNKLLKMMSMPCQSSP